MYSWLRVGKVHEKLLTTAPRVARYIHVLLRAPTKGARAWPASDSNVARALSAGT